MRRYNIHFDGLNTTEDYMRVCYAFFIMNELYNKRLVIGDTDEEYCGNNIIPLDAFLKSHTDCKTLCLCTGTMSEDTDQAVTLILFSTENDNSITPLMMEFEDFVSNDYVDAFINLLKETYLALKIQSL